MAGNIFQWRIQDFPQGGAPTPKITIIFQIFAKNCMKMKEFGPPGGGRASLAPPLDPPMYNSGEYGLGKHQSKAATGSLHIHPFEQTA